MNEEILLSPQDLASEQIVDLQLAASKMNMLQRRRLMAEMALKYCHGSARLTETTFGWSRFAVETGLGEKKTGIRCIGLQSLLGGNKRWEERHPKMASFLIKTADNQSQQDPTFHSTVAYTRLTAASALRGLKDEGFNVDDLPSPSSMAEILNRLGYRLRKIVKAKPLKKIKETDAIFDNIKKGWKN